jgi:phosphatidylinositol-3-phosphatase
MRGNLENMRYLGALLLICLALTAQAKTFIVMEENHHYEEVIGSPSMPYFNSLAKSNALATNYYANTHPSIGNYFKITTGKTISNYDGFSSTVYDDNIVRHLIKAGKTWKEYSECLPYVGYFQGDYGCYERHHNPCSYFSDVRLSSEQQRYLVPLARLDHDIANGTLPDFGLIVPSNQHNGHDGTLAQADNWLQNNISTLIAALDTNDLLIITWDESDKSDDVHGGGHIVWVVVGPPVKKRYKSSTLYQHENCLKFMCDRLRISCPVNATGMNEFLK